MLLALAIALALPAPIQAFDLQGHRGARGLAPENTIAAFRKALEIGVTTIETDLGITRDRKIVIAHDATLNPNIVRDAKGDWIVPPLPSIFSLDLATIRTFDVGRLRPDNKYAAQWPDQQSVDGERMPTLDELLALARSAPKPVRLNIETKLSPLKSDETVGPSEFVRLVVDAVRASGMAERVTIQSFDWRTLREMQRIAPEIATVCLTIDSVGMNTLRALGDAPSPWLGGLDLRDHGHSVPALVKAAGCAVWSPFWRNVSAENVRESHALGLRVIPWTVNAPGDMGALIDMKVDGLITDYPDRARVVMGEKGLAPP